jgi:hypothetical protein
MVAWIGRGGTIALPPRWPDLTPLGFFVWGQVKDKVFVQTLPVQTKHKDILHFVRYWRKSSGSVVK